MAKVVGVAGGRSWGMATSGARSVVVEVVVEVAAFDLFLMASRKPVLSMVFLILGHWIAKMTTMRRMPARNTRVPVPGDLVFLFLDAMIGNTSHREEEGQA